MNTQFITINSSPLLFIEILILLCAIPLVFGAIIRYIRREIRKQTAPELNERYTQLSIFGFVTFALFLIVLVVFLLSSSLVVKLIAIWLGLLLGVFSVIILLFSFMRLNSRL